MAVACIPLGYRLAEQSGPSAAKKTAATESASASKGPAVEGTNNFDNSALIAEWRELHAKYGTNAQAMPELYKAIGKLNDVFRRRALQTALIAEWAEVDPAGGLEFFLGKGRSEDQRRQFIQEWLTRDPVAAVTALLARSNGLDRLPREFLTNVAVVLPAKLPELVSHLPGADSYWDKSVQNAFAIVAQKDLSSAIASAQAVSGVNRDQALAGVAKTWGQADLKAAIAWARTLPDGIDRDEIIRAALVGRAAVDPAGALDNAGEVPAGGRHAYFASTTGARILQEAANADFGATVAWLAAHPGRFDREDLYGLVEPVTERMNAGAADFLSACLADGSLSALAPAIQNSLLNRAAGERAAVWEWLKNQPDSEPIKSIRAEVLSSAAWQEPEFALQLVGDLPQTAAGDAEVKELARCLFNGGNRLDRFERLLSESPERLKGPLVEEAFDTVYSYMDDPQKWIGRLSLLPDASRPKAMGELGNAWAQQSPEEAAGWVASLPAGDGRDRAAGGVAAEWARKDPVAADEWVSLLPQGSERDRAAAGLVSALAEQSPDQAWTWALGIGDDAQRKDALTRAAKGMASRDPNMARQWIVNGPFTPEMKAELQVALDKPIKPARWE